MKSWLTIAFVVGAISCFGQKEMVLPDVPAEFPGGSDSLTAFIQRNAINYLTPEDAQCHMVVGFVVSYEGEIVNIQIEEGCSQSMNSEAVRLLKIMPNWIPATVKDRPVNTKCRLPLIFDPPTEEEMKKKRKRSKQRKK